MGFIVDFLNQKNTKRNQKRPEITSRYFSSSKVEKLLEIIRFDAVFL